jgi:GNAT superfamily N-acetyltransferase
MNDSGVENAFEGPRPARIEERDELIEMINVVFRISAGRAPTIATDWAHVYSPANLENVLVVTARGKVVASTGVWMSEVVLSDARLRVGGINCVGTLPEYRRHGLAGQLVRAANARMRELGCHVGLLHTGIANWYRRIGWELAGSARTYRVDRGNSWLLPQLPDASQCRFVEDGEAGVIAAVIRLYNQENLGATRTIESFRQLRDAKKQPQIFVAEPVQSGGVPSAYLLLKENNILEWAGSAEAVAGLVRACFEALDDPNVSTSQRTNDAGSVALQSLNLTTPGWQHPLVDRLDRLGIPFRGDYLGMIHLVDPQAVLNAFGYSLVQVEAAGETAGSAEGEKFIVTVGDASLHLNRNQLTKLFFGPERVSDFGGELFPLPFWQWYLEQV